MRLDAAPQAPRDEGGKVIAPILAIVGLGLVAYALGGDESGEPHARKAPRKRATPRTQTAEEPDDEPPAVEVVKAEAPTEAPKSETLEEKKGGIDGEVGGS